jgi:hypothetical protein
MDVRPVSPTSPQSIEAVLVGAPSAPSRRISSTHGTRKTWSGVSRRPVIFLFPDSQDQVDPSYDFDRESSSLDRVRQRDDRYAHEVIAPSPYDGMLLSKALVDGRGSKYTLAQRHRLYRLGVRRFFRLDQVEGPALTTMGDCGAFNYVREEKPPYSPEEVLEFYAECDFDYGISVDHVILDYQPEPTDVVRPLRPPDPEWAKRQKLTLEYAGEFLRLHRVRQPRFQPLGVAQGWSPRSYAHAVQVLQKIGYRHIALGGMVPLKTAEILSCLRAISDVRYPETHFHLLGVTRTEQVLEFREYGVTSFDSTSPFRQAFMDDTDNYYTADGSYVAIRVMQIDSNHRLKQKVLAGQLDQNKGRSLEEKCLRTLDAYDRHEVEVEAPLRALRRYTNFLGEPDRTDEYRRTLDERPWRACDCAICRDAGIQVVIFRGTERNKRRGFHNLHVFNQRLHRELALAS